MVPHGSFDRSRLKLNTTLSTDRVQELKHNAFLNSMHRSLRVALETQRLTPHGSFDRSRSRTQHNAFLRVALWDQKRTLCKCSDKNESFYLQKVCFSDREKSFKFSHHHPKRGRGRSFYRGFVVIPTDLY
ncbi:hypothetical protein LEP1GSC126_4211 [Leptospira kirschneri str. 200801774]|nr:hypothetical protein LEP1GSC126_4211 [Leptospira kirschneri str. 200801774]